MNSDIDHSKILTSYEHKTTKTKKYLSTHHKFAIKQTKV